MKAIRDWSWSILLTFLLIGCVGQKKVVKEAHRVESEKETTIKKDSSKVVDRSLAINDKIQLSLKTNDKKIDSLIRLRLKGFSTQKKSGKNYYTAKFDYEKLALILATVVGETKNINTETNTEKDTKEDIKQSDYEYFYAKIKVVPWWLWVLVAFFLLPKIIDNILYFVSPFKSLFKRLLKDV